MNFTRKLTVTALSVSMLFSIPFSAFCSNVTVEKPVAKSTMKAKDYAKRAKEQFEKILKEANAEKLAESQDALAYKLLNAYGVIAEAGQARNGQRNDLKAALTKLGFSVIDDNTKLYNLDIKKINKGRVYNTETAVFSVDKKQAEAVKAKEAAVRHLQQVMPKEYGVTDFNVVSTSPIAEIKVDVPVPTASSWIPSKKTLAALTIGLGSIAAYKYTRAGDWADAGFAKFDDLTGNRVSPLFAYGSDTLGAGKDWATSKLSGLGSGIAGYAKALWSKRPNNPFSMPSMDTVKSYIPFLGAQAVEAVVAAPVVEVVTPVVKEVVDTTTEAAFERVQNS